MPSNAAVGFFGKLPSNGDFLQRRVPQSFLDIWDPWLQECVHASRESLQEAWLPAYLTSPVWRFVLPEAICGSGAYAGILAPSVDRVGRYFPMTIVTQVDIDANPLDFAMQRRSWFDALESLLVTALGETEVDLEWFDAQVIEHTRFLDGEIDASGPALKDLFQRSQFPKQGEYWRTPLATAGSLQAAVNAFAYRELSAQLRPTSVWWTEGSGASAPAWLSLRGLPAPNRFGAMLNGQWLEHGWQDLGELPGVREISAHAEPEAALEGAMVDSIPLGQPRATVPEVQLSAIESNRAAFVIRPEIGLWAVVATDRDSDPTAVRMIADALQQLSPAPSLSALVEAVRLTLTEVHGDLARLAARDVQRVDAWANAVTLLSTGAECAFLSAGKVQKLRVRARTLESVDDADDIEDAPSPAPGSLMDLLTDSVSSRALGKPGFQGLRAHYERLQREDHWILCARPVLSNLAVSRLAAAAASAMPITAATVVDMLNSGSADEEILPVMTVEI
jgi:type VI secretion system protein ImpM